MQDAIAAIGEPRRRAILRLVRETELPAGEIAAEFGDVSRPAVSQHLRVLLEAGLLAERRDGTRRLYRARPEGLEDLREFLDQFWDQRLETLRHEAQREERRRRNDRGSRN
jgi:DNA-binding transcriptional ArsR family regulator